MERARFVLRLEQGERMSDLCREFGISRKTGYKLKQRYEAMGVEAFGDQSRRPITSPYRTPTAIEEAIVSLRKERPTWGPEKLLDVLNRSEPGVRWPGKSTTSRILAKHGLAQGKKRRRYPKSTGTPLGHAQAPNDIWCADFKGEFRLGNGQYCYPLTISDAYSRYLLCCEAFEGPRLGPTRAAFESTFARFGLPKAIRTDNGAPFASPGLFSLSKLSVWWWRLGIRSERIEPGNPEQNGRHERMHLTLKQEATRPPGDNVLQQQERFDHFLEDYNEQRPHQALGNQRPAELYHASVRSLPSELAPLSYPLHDLTRKVSSYGVVYMGRRKRYRLSAALAGELVGLREVEVDRWLVTWRHLDLGHLNVESGEFEPGLPPEELLPMS